MSNATQCAASAYRSQGGWGHSYQCGRKAGFGPEGKYCKQHALPFTEGDTVTWYRVTKWTDYSCEVVPVQVLEEKEKTLLVKGERKAAREKKTSEYYSYFKTLDEAITFYERRAEGLRERVKALEKQIERLKPRTSAVSGDSEATPPQSGV